MELESARRRLKNIRAAVGIKNLIGPLEKMSEGLTVIAVADAAIARVTRRFAQHASQCAACTANREVARVGFRHGGKPSDPTRPAQSLTESS